MEYVIKHKTKTRSFEILREYVVPKLQEIFAKNGRKLAKKPFTKHFWSYYLKESKNIEIKKAWKILPRTKPGVSSRVDESDISFISDMLDPSESNDDEDNNPLIFEVEENLHITEEVKDAVIEIKPAEESCKFIDFQGFDPIEDFFTKDVLFENGGFLKEKEEPEIWRIIYEL